LCIHMEFKYLDVDVTIFTMDSIQNKIIHNIWILPKEGRCHDKTRQSEVKYKLINQPTVAPLTYPQSPDVVYPPFEQFLCVQPWINSCIMLVHLNNHN
jgi:hypothetical protein